MSPERIDLGALMAQSRRSLDPAKYPEEVFELYSVPAFSSGTPEVIAGKGIGSSKQLVQSGDVLLSKIVPHIRRAWVVRTRCKHRMIASNEWIVFRGDKHHPDYLRHLLVSDWLHPQLMQTVSGVGGSLLRARPSYVAKITIPLPPLPEQKRIAAILDKADELRRQRREAITKLDTLIQSIFLDMFGDPLRNPKGWPTYLLQDLIMDGDKINYGVVQPGDHVSDGIHIVRVGDFRHGTIDKTDMKKIAPGIEAQYRRSRLVGDEILIACVGSIGKVALADESLQGFNVVRAVARVRVGEVVNRVYLAAFLQTPFIQSFFTRETRTVSQPTLNIKQICETPIHLPPVEHQAAFAERITTVFNQRRLIAEQSEHMSALFTSMQQTVFSRRTEE